MDKSENRRERLKRLVADAGGHNAFVKRHKLSTSRSSFISQVINGYSFGEKSAEKLAGELKLDPDYFDRTSEQDKEMPKHGPDQSYGDAYWRTVQFCWGGLSDEHKDAVALLVNSLFTIDNPGAVGVSNPRRRKADIIDLGNVEPMPGKALEKKTARHN